MERLINSKEDFLEFLKKNTESEREFYLAVELFKKYTLEEITDNNIFFDKVIDDMNDNERKIPIIQEQIQEFRDGLIEAKNSEDKEYVRSYVRAIEELLNETKLKVALLEKILTLRNEAENKNDLIQRFLADDKAKKSILDDMEFLGEYEVLASGQEPIPSFQSDESLFGSFDNICKKAIKIIDEKKYQAGRFDKKAIYWAIIKAKSNEGTQYYNYSKSELINIFKNFVRSNRGNQKLVKELKLKDKDLIKELADFKNSTWEYIYKVGKA